MTLLKKLILVNLLIIMILLASVMAIDYVESRNYAQSQLHQSTVNSVSVLSGKLSRSQGERADIESIIDAEFDSGYYRSIKYLSRDGDWEYKQEYNELPKGVPNWFVKLANVVPFALSKDVSSGWNIIGKVYVQADTNALHIALYKTFISLLYLFIISTILSILAISALIKVILKPLKQIQAQAEGISHHNEFIVQKNIPRTVEFRDVVLAMNSMVKKIKALFDNANKELTELKKKDFTDTLTKLNSRIYFIDKLPEYLKPDAQNIGGVNIIIGIEGVIEANQKLGVLKVNDLYMDIADIFRDATKEFDESIVARMNGTEFDIFIPGCSIESVSDKVQSIKREAIETIKRYGLDYTETYLSFGICEYHHSQNISELLSMTDSTLQRAKNSSSRIYLHRLDSDLETKGKDEWRETINQSLKDSSFSFVTSKVINTKTDTPVHSILNIAMQAQKKLYTYEEFMPIAIELGLSSKIYSQAISTLLLSGEIETTSHISALRLPFDYLNSEGSYEEIRELNMKFLSWKDQTLVLEVSDNYIRKNPIFVDIYRELFSKQDISIGIFEFIGESEDYEYLQKLNPDYIKTDAHFLLSQTPQELLALKTLTKTLNISLIATGVMDEDTVENLKSVDIYKMQGVYIV